MTLRCAGIQISAWAILLLLSQTAVCSEFLAEHGCVIRNWDTEEGLPVSNVSAMAKTADGYMWIGTSSGLVRYDGVRFKTYYPENAPALRDARISALLTARDGELWIGTSSGALVRFAMGRFDEVSLGTTVPKAAVAYLAEDSRGTIWGIVERAGIFSHRDGQTVFYGTNSLPSPMVWGITPDLQAGLWAVAKWRLMHFDGTKWSLAEGLPADFPRVSMITPRRKGGLWIAAVGQTGLPSGDRGARIFKYEGGRLIEDSVSVPWNQDSRRSLPRLLMEDGQGRLWLATRGAGIFVRDGGKWQPISDSPALSQAQANFIGEDEDKAIWIGMDGGGIYQLRPRSVAVLEPPSRIPSGCFWTVYPASDGSVWGGTDGNGIFHWKNGVWKHFECAQGLTNLHVNAIIEDRQKNIWAGTMGGLFVLRNDRFKSVTDVETLRLPVFALKESRSGDLWLGTRNGLVQMNREATNVFAREQGIPLGPINAIEEDRAGRIWVSIPPYRDGRSAGPVGPYGLFAKSGKRFEHIAEGKWAGEPHIRCLQADAAGGLWIGTISAGFFRLRDGKLTEFSREDGLPNNRIQAIVPDNAGNLWFCSELGIFGCPIQQLDDYARSRNARLNWWRIQRSDGLPNKSATGNGQPSAARGADGQLWFSNGNALTGFDPQHVIRSARLRPPLIEEIFVDGVAQAPEANGRLRITTEIRRVEIHYTSPNTSTPDLPTFWVRLKGFDADWVKQGKTRVITYDLQPGDYEFAVAVTGPDGSRLETAKPLQIEVVPRFRERAAVRICAGVLFVAGIAAGVWWWERARSRRRLRELEIQQAMDQVRQRIARDIHDDLGAGLTEITLLSDNLRADIRGPDTGEKTVERIAARARALTHEMDEVVWAINPRTDTLESLVTYLNDFAQERLTLAGIRCRLNTAAELPNLQLPADLRHSLYRAAKEALNNATKHAGATEVAITIEARADDLLFIVQDNGRGFDPGQPLKRGNGLKNMRTRLVEIGGSCEIQSSPGKGTTVCFTIPRAAAVSFHPSTNGHSLRS